MALRIEKKSQRTHLRVPLKTHVFSRLLERTSHPKVWLAFAKFEQSQGQEFERFKNHFRTAHGVFSERNCLLLFN